ELVKNGRVPPPEAFVVEGMFADHDLPLDGPPCDRTLCLRGAAGWAPAADGVPSGWVQVGLSSSIDPATFVRPSLTLIACVDVSGSMGWEYQSGMYPSGGELSRALLRQLAAQLGPRDRFALVAYGRDVATVLPLVGGDAQSTIGSAIDGLHTTGSTNM